AFLGIDPHLALRGDSPFVVLIGLPNPRSRTFARSCRPLRNKANGRLQPRRAALAARARKRGPARWPARRGSAASPGWAAGEFQIGLITAIHRAIPRPKMM